MNRLRTYKEHRARLILVHSHSMDNYLEIQTSEVCGCFYCLERFSPIEIKEWVNHGDRPIATAVCPKCGIDSIISDASGFKIALGLLRKLQRLFFWEGCHLNANGVRLS